MAVAWFNALAHPDKARAESAGVEPPQMLLASVVSVMREVTLDVGLNVPRPMTENIRAQATLVIAFGPDESDIPAFLDATEPDDVWLVDDPAGQPIEQVRKIRADVETLVRRLLRERGWMPFGASVPPAPR